MGALAIHEAVHLALLAQVCTAMGTEALTGTLAGLKPSTNLSGLILASTRTIINFANGLGVDWAKHITHF